MTNTTIYVVWKYDHYPYFLCGEVSKYLSNGYVEVKGYGGSRFKPLKFIWGKFAHTLKGRIDALQIDECKARKEHDQDWRAKANSLFDNEI